MDTTILIIIGVVVVWLIVEPYVGILGLFGSAMKKKRDD